MDRSLDDISINLTETTRNPMLAGTSLVCSETTSQIYNTDCDCMVQGSRVEHSGKSPRDCLVEDPDTAKGAEYSNDLNDPACDRCETLGKLCEWDTKYLACTPCRQAHRGCSGKVPRRIKRWAERTEEVGTVERGKRNGPGMSFPYICSDTS